MIISEEIEITITNQGKYYASLGYPLLKQGEKLKVKISDLPKQSNKKVKCICDGCGIEFERQYQLVMRDKKSYEKDFCRVCARFSIAEKMDYSHLDVLNKKQTGSDHPRWNPNKKAFQEYAYKVRRITEETYARHSNEINPDSLTRTLCGVEGGYQLDHRISIHKGFKLGINPKVIGSLDNLQMLPWEDNRNKHK